MNAHALPTSPALPAHTAYRLGRLAVVSLHTELACSPKPGLVTPHSSGSHDDMDARTFMRSLFALRGYFVEVAATAAHTDAFASLRTLGINAERAMLAATGGINTHRGAIFSLGLLVAAAARQRAAGLATDADTVCAMVSHWQADLLQAPLDPNSPGQRARTAHGIAGVREQAAAGYPVLRQLAIPTLRNALQQGLTRDAALTQTLMVLVAEVDDLNLLHRGGAAGLQQARQLARNYLRDGGSHAPGWQQRLHVIGMHFEQHRLSPGGSADLLACAWFLLQQEPV